MLDCHQHKKYMLARLEGVEHINQAEALKGMKIFVPEDDVQVGEDEFLWQDLIGCTVMDQAGRKLGVVAALHDYGAQDILEIKTTTEMETQGEWLLPFVEDVIADVDISKKMIDVVLLDGMDACFTPRS